MNLEKLYNSLISKAITENGKPQSFRDTKEGYEKHHIKPKSLGGNDDLDNLVFVSHKQHYVAHHILARWLGGGMASAFWLMTHEEQGTNQRDYKITSRQYQTARQLQREYASNFLSGRKLSDETREKIRQANTGKAMPEFVKEMLRTINTGRALSEQTKNKIRMASIARATPEMRMKVSEFHKGRPKTEETKRRMKEAANNRPKLTCPHCSKEGSANQMKRYHFDNCKHIPT